ncbi:flagellar protein FlhE [Photorhabdus stackebrandtii]|uniref:Flagellar protein FlhE n=2 Tax=Photorhabdus stackebrandtii TaxID=1123042 RepID=A0A7X5QJM3_9GAMM|nr:flagellar protein FlhE [Photorhabdus stackebrandtii]NHB95474.1 flagellar protein FlhE [Photorhabdus stackebrandtii]
MKLKKILGMGSALLLTLFSQAALSASYQSSVVLPTVYSRNYTETAYLPVVGSPPASGSISNVSWTWNVVGWPQGLSVYLCQGDTNSCIDISRIRRMSTTAFNNRSPAQQFFYALRVANGGTVPVAGQMGEITVTW